MIVPVVRIEQKLVVPHVASHRPATSSAAGTVSPRASARQHDRVSSEFSETKMKLSHQDSDSASMFSEGSISSAQVRKPRQQSFLDLEESPSRHSIETKSLSSSQKQRTGLQKLPDQNGYEFNELVDRLLSRPLSKTEGKFSAIFLALYRYFAAPSQLLEAIIHRFEALNLSKGPGITRIMAQQHYLNIIEQWINLYSGDFAHHKTYSMMNKFISKLSKTWIFNVAAREILADLEVVTEDDDTNWACSDRSREEYEMANAKTLNEDSGDGKLPEGAVGLAITVESGAFGPSTTCSTCESTSQSNSIMSSSATMLNAVESAQQQAALLVPSPCVSLSKVQLTHFMSESDDSIARELTRMDWIMFSSIRPRDLVRHVSLSLDEKKRCASLKNVSRMIEHFNHLAYWVANFVLLRDKPKQRYEVLEKFMRIARKLRRLNNYNSLGAILAGINGTALHRLAATRKLVSPAVSKDFMKLEILMGTQKSHAAYRLAWENSTGERIPYMPLHRRDLVGAAEGNPTFIGEKRRAAGKANVEVACSATYRSCTTGVIKASGNAAALAAITAQKAGDSSPVMDIYVKKKKGEPVCGKERINWRKFEIMGEVIIGLQTAQSMPYSAFGRNDEVRGLLFDTKIDKEDERLCDRSVEIEPATMAERKWYKWF